MIILKEKNKSKM